MSAYNLYVNAAANPLNANGSPQHPYKKIQHAVNHILNDPVFHNYDNPSQWATINVAPSETGYNENIVIDFRGTGLSTYPLHLTMQAMSDNPEDCPITISDTDTPGILVKGTSINSFSIDGFFIKHDVIELHENDGIVIDGISPSGSFGTFRVDNCIFEVTADAIRNQVRYIDNVIVTDSKFHFWYDIQTALINDPRGIVVDNTGGPGGNIDVQVEGNEFISYYTPWSHPAQAIFLGNPCSVATIVNNIFSRCALLTYDNAERDLSICDNEFYGAWIQCDEHGGQLQIENNLFTSYSNEAHLIPAITLLGYSYHFGTLVANIVGNTFSNCTESLHVLSNEYIDLGTPWEVVKLVYLKNNSFLGSSSRLKLQRGSNTQSNRIVEYVNNLCALTGGDFFWITNLDDESITLPSDQLIPISYSHFTQLTPSASLDIDSNTVHYGNAQITMTEDTDVYELLWNETVKSPLINAGCPEIDGVPQYDPDGTPPDIGAVYYPHHTKKYFERHNLSGIYWLSFPVVDDRTNTNGSLYWNELGQMFEEHMLYAPNSNLIDISWSYDTDAGVFKYNGSEWDHLEHPVSQPKGYKVQFNDWVSNCAVVVDGFKADPNTTPVAWAVRDAQNQPFQNWVGYFATFTQGAGDALSRYLPGSTRFRYIDYVHTIKTQTWSTCRMSEEFGSPWVINPNTYTVSEGDMMILLLFPDAPEEMYWLSPSSSKPPIEKPRATAFEYTEKLDYTPVYLQFDPQNMPTEVGLYVNGECKGAAVVDSTLIDVCLYTDDAKDGGELEIVFYHEGKGKKAAQGWKTYNHDSMVFEDTGLRTDQIGRYAYLSFSNKEGDSPVPLVTCLSQNYPNPFNPETNISFVLAKDMSARLDIYNVRGQKVSTLCNSELTKGKHTLQWNGRDAQGRKVASGIYFSRLATPDGSFSQKMMLMK